MLVLGRKRGEQIVVPQCALTITIVAIEGNTVRLGISAPAEVAVYREEIWRRLESQPHHTPDGNGKSGGVTRAVKPLPKSVRTVKNLAPGPEAPRVGKGSPGTE